MTTPTTAEIRAEHTNYGEACEHCSHRFPYDNCVACGDEWPCATVALCDRVEQLEAALRAVDAHTEGWSLDTAASVIDNIRITARYYLGETAAQTANARAVLDGKVVA